MGKIFHRALRLQVPLAGLLVDEFVVLLPGLVGTGERLGFLLTSCADLAPASGEVGAVQPHVPELASPVFGTFKVSGLPLS